MKINVSKLSENELKDLSFDYSKKNIWDEDALAINEELLKHDINNVDTLTKLAKCHEFLNDLVMAQLCYEEILSLDRGNVFANKNYVKRFNLHKVTGCGYDDNILSYFEKKDLISLFLDSYKSDCFELRKKVKVLKNSFSDFGVYHYIDISELGRILSNGYLYSKNFCRENDVKFFDFPIPCDYKNEDVVSFYFRPCNSTLYFYEGINFKENIDFIPIPVYLVFSDDLIYLKDTEIIQSNLDNNADLLDKSVWEVLFNVTDYSHIKEIKSDIFNEPILISNSSVSLKYLKKIAFRSEAEMKLACSLYGKNDLYVVETKYFPIKETVPKESKYYNNYISDYNIAVGKNNSITVYVELDKPLCSYRLEFMLKNSFGNQLIHPNKITMLDKNKKKTTSSNKAKYITYVFSNAANDGVLEVLLNEELCIKESLIISN